MRKKSRLDRRPSLPREPVWRFYPRYWAGVAVKTFQWVGLYLRLRRKLSRDQARSEPFRLYRPRDDAGARRRGRDPTSCSRLTSPRPSSATSSMCAKCKPGAEVPGVTFRPQR